MRFAINKRPLSIAAAIVFTVAAVSLAGPAIKVDYTTFDFGKTVQHVQVTHDFLIESVGDDTLIITRIVPGCGCTKAPIQDSILAPGERTLLSIALSTKSYAGSITKTPYLMTNISADRVMLTIKAEVMIEESASAPLKISPFEIKIPSSNKPDKRQAAFLLENRGDQDLLVSLVDMDASLLEVELPERIKPGQAATGIVKVRRDVAVENFEKSITFEVADTKRTRYSLPVSMTAKPAGGPGTR